MLDGGTALLQDLVPRLEKRADVALKMVDSSQET